METSSKTKKIQAPKSVTSAVAGGKVLPAKPVLQQKEQDGLIPAQLATGPNADNLATHKRTRFNPVQKKTNNTGLPDNLKSGIENLGGYDMNDVKVHYNSAKPAAIQAHAYAQGTDIHIGPGQEKHLPHEAWHVVQQKQGRVKATVQMKGSIPVNDDKGLENEADVMGAKASNINSMSVAGNSEKTTAYSAQINPVVQGDFEDDFHDIKDNNLLMKPGMTALHGAAKIGQAGLSGVKKSANFAAAPARWAAEGVNGTSSRFKQGLYITGGIIGSAVSAPLGAVGGAVSGGLGLAGAAIAGGVGLAGTVAGGLATGAVEGGKAAYGAAKNFSLDNARGIYAPTATHPVYGDLGMRRAPLAPAPLAGPVVSAPVDIPSARSRGGGGSGLMVGAPPPRSILRDRSENNLLSSGADDSFGEDIEQPRARARGYGTFMAPGPIGDLSEPLLGSSPRTPHMDALAPASDLLGDGADFEAARRMSVEDDGRSLLSRALAERRPAPPLLPAGPLPPVRPAAAGPAPVAALGADYGEHNPDGSRKNYGQEGRKELGKYGILGTGVAASAAGRVAYLHGAVDTSALGATTPFIEGFGGAAGIIGGVSDLIDTGEGIKGAADKAKDGHGRFLSGVSAASGLASATKSSATAAWNIGSLVHGSGAVSAGAQVAAGGAAIATGTLDIGRGVYGAALAHKRMGDIQALSGSADERIRTAAEVAGASQERERTKGIATALKGGVALAGGILLTASMATPVGWALLGGAALIAGIAAIYNYKKKGELKEKIAEKELGVAVARADWNREVNRAKAHTTWGTTRRKTMVDACGVDPLRTALDTHGFKDAGHFYSNYINFTANYMFQEGIASGAPNREIQQLITSMGLEINTRTGQPTAEKIAKQLSI